MDFVLPTIFIAIDNLSSRFIREKPSGQIFDSDYFINCVRYSCINYYGKYLLEHRWNPWITLLNFLTCGLKVKEAI